MKSYRTYSINSENQGLTVELYLKDILQYSGRKIQRLTRLHGIQLNKKKVFLQKKVKAGDVLHVLVLEDQSYGVLPEEGSVEILYEDTQVIVLNKPSNMLVHPTGQTSKGTLANYLAYAFQQRGEVFTIRPLHRLDRDTSGCVIFAKDAQTQSILEQQLHTGTFKRIYYAIVEGALEPQEGMIDAAIGAHPSKPNRRAVTEQGEKAITYYRTLKSWQIKKYQTKGLKNEELPPEELPNQRSVKEYSLLELSLETGRTHQIRVHLAHILRPIIGDKMYGRGSCLIGRQALHAESVSFVHTKGGQEITVRAPMPADFIGILAGIEE